MKPKILKINLFVIFFLFANFVKTDIKHKGILYSEFSGIKANQARKLSKDDGGYMILYYKSEAKYSEGFKNTYRNNITYIINGDNDTYISDYESFNISSRTKIEIHFNNPPTSLQILF